MLNKHDQLENIEMPNKGIISQQRCNIKSIQKGKYLAYQERLPRKDEIVTVMYWAKEQKEFGKDLVINTS